MTITETHKRENIYKCAKMRMTWNGFKLTRGMFFGYDAQGAFATWGNTHTTTNQKRQNPVKGSSGKLKFVEGIKPIMSYDTKLIVYRQDALGNWIKRGEKNPELLRFVRSNKIFSTDTARSINAQNVKLNQMWVS